MTDNTHGQVPAIQRYKIGYHSDEWGMRSSTPGGIYDDAGPWVRYEDHAAVITALRAQQPTTAQATPAAVAGLSKAITASIMRDDGGDHPAFCLMVAYRSQADAEAALELLAAAPTTQPAPQQEPFGWYVTGCGRLLDEHDAKTEAKHIGGTASAAPLYTAPQPSPAAQEDK